MSVYPFLSQFLTQLNERKITYCVLKNYDRLPEYVGNDVDIWVKDGEQEKFQKTLFEVAKSLGWDIIEYSPRLSYQGEGDYFLVKDDKRFSAIHIDCWAFLYWKGITYVDEKVFPEHLLFHENGFYTPSHGIEASILLLQNLLYHRKVAEKYKNRIFEYSNEDPCRFLEAIKKPFGEKIAKFILSLAKVGRWDDLEKNYNFLRWTLFKRALLYKPFLQLGHWTIYFYGQLKKFLFPSYGLFLVLIGPDGSGKSTIANAILNSEVSKKLFQKKLYFHGHFPFLPELKRIASFFRLTGQKEAVVSFGNPSEHSKPFGPFRSTVYPLYYGLNYFLGHFLIRKEGARGGLIIFDRYFYDYLIQRQFIKCPGWLLFLIAKVIPRPDAIVYLKNSPDVIRARKPELSIEEIERQNEVCERIVRRFPNGFVVETSSEPEKVAEKIQWIMLRKIREIQARHKYENTLCYPFL